MADKHRDRKASQLILPGAPEPEDEVQELDEQITEALSQQAVQLLATNIAIAALVREVAKLSADPSGLTARLRQSSAAILDAMPMPSAEPEFTKLFRDTVDDNIALIFEMIEQNKRD
ncbi:MAG: hypothetical protein ACREQR_02400 [Candidatus Binataceae bacterium]